MFARLYAVALGGLISFARGLRFWHYGALALFVFSLAYKLNWLDHQFNIGGMNHWKWKVNIGALMIVSFWTLFVRLRASIISLAVLDAVLSFVIFADLIYFRYFKDFISVPVLLQAGQVGELQDSIWSLVENRDWIYFADLPVALLIVAATFFFTRSSRRTNKPQSSIWFKIVPSLLSLSIGIALIYYPVEEQKHGWARGLFVGNWWNVPIYNVTGLFGFHGYDAYRYANEHWFGKGLSKTEIQDAREWYAGRAELQNQMTSEPLFGAYKGKNILIVQAEAFQSFVIGQSIGGEEITPNLNKLIGQSIYFPNFYHQTAQGRTSDADFATSCSMHPLPTGSVFIRFAGNTFDCAPDIMKSQGYDATVHHAYDGSFWNRNTMYHNMKYDRFYTIKDYEMDEKVGWSLADPSFFRQTVEQIKERNHSPFYALSISLSSHHPFKMPYSKQELKVGELEDTILGDYVQAIHYVDYAVGELINELQEQGLWDDTILLFYGDHDNSVQNWSLYEKLFGTPVAEIDKDRLIRKVPFLIHLPNDENAGVIEKSVGQMDTLPTLMHLLGIPADGRYLMGTSMLSAAEKSVVFRNGGFTDGKVYYVPNNDGIIAHGVCYPLPGDEPAQDPAACAPGAEAAKLELEISDRVIEHNLIPKFREDDDK